jgi:hypothetical protein
MLSKGLAFLACAAASGALALGACGDDDSDEPADRTTPFRTTPLREPAESGTESRTACDLLHPPGMKGTPNDSLDLSICDWRGRGRHIQLVLDTAPRAQLRYYNQLSEQLQFHNPEPRRRPYQLKHVGDDSAYGGAGAWWTPSKRQLVAYKDGRILRIRVEPGGRRTAARLARRAFRRLSEPAG